MKLPLRLALALAGCALLASSASAQSFFWNTGSARSQALGGIYVTSSNDAVDALAANPAGLTSLTGRTLDVSVSLVAPRGSFSNSVNNSAQMSQTPGAIPYGAFAMPIRHSRFSFGIGFVPDLASVSDWHYVDAPGTAGATYGLQEQKSAILAGRAIAGLGVVVNPKLSLGFTLGADYNSNTLDAPYVFQQQPVLQGLKTLLDLHTTGYGWNGSVGAVIRPTPSGGTGAGLEIEHDHRQQRHGQRRRLRAIRGAGLGRRPFQLQLFGASAQRASAIGAGERGLARESAVAVCVPDRLGELG